MNNQQGGNLILVASPKNQVREEAMRIALEYHKKLSIYDSIFIALAKDSDFELITSDADQSHVAKGLGLEVLLL